MKKTLLAILMAALTFAAFANGSVEKEASAAAETSAKAKYVFLFIGDGMAMPQITAAEAFLNNGTDSGIKKLNFTQFPASGLTTTYSSNAFITDSAAAGTALATGQKTESGVISMDAGKTKKLKTIAEMAKESGMKVGIISSVDVDHATPATFYAHNESRNNYYDICLQMANSNFDYFAGGLIKTYKTPEGEKNAIDLMKENGWAIAETREELNALEPGTQAYAYYATSFTNNSLDYAMDMEKEDITLAEYTAKGIEMLDNEDGFFMMVEGGKIDWACHANDAAASIKNTVAFDNAIAEAVEFYNAHPEDTLIVVTGDHETGGLTLGFAGTKYSSAIAMVDKQKMSYEAFNKFVLGPYKEAHADDYKFEDVLPAVKENFGLTELSELEMAELEKAFLTSMGSEDVKSSDEQTYLLYGGYEPFTMTLTHILNQRAGLAWTSYSHTGVPVATFAMGAGEELFVGYYDNTDIFKKLAKVSDL